MLLFVTELLKKCVEYIRKHVSNAARVPVFALTCAASASGPRFVSDTCDEKQHFFKHFPKVFHPIFSTMASASFNPKVSASEQEQLPKFKLPQQQTAVHSVFGLTGVEQEIVPVSCPPQAASAASAAPLPSGMPPCSLRHLIRLVSIF